MITLIAVVGRRQLIHFITKGRMRKARIEILDGMRGIAALAVMFYHFTLGTDFALFPHGYLAVDLFFGLSGFVISYSYRKRLQDGMLPGEFILKRLIRLYPMFLLSLVIAIPALILFTEHGQTSYSLRDIISSIFCNAFFIPYFNTKQIIHSADVTAYGVLFPANGPAWSLFFELIASFCFLIWAQMSPQDLKKIILVALLLMVSGSALQGFSNYRFVLLFNNGWGTLNFLGGFPRSIFSFTLGMLLFELKDHPVVNRLSFLFKPWLIYSILLATLLFPKDLYGFYYLIVICSIAPMLIIAGSRAICANSVSRTIAQFLGWISYPVYCLHSPILRIVKIFTLTHHYPFHWIAVAIAAIITLACAVLATLCIEEPVRRYLSRKLLDDRANAVI